MEGFSIANVRDFTSGDVQGWKHWSVSGVQSNVGLPILATKAREPVRTEQMQCGRPRKTRIAPDMLDI